MTQTNAIILRIDSEKMKEFEAIFEKEDVPLWRKFKSEGKFLSASLTHVQDGNQGKKGVRDNILHVVVPSMKEHHEFDTNPSFTCFLPKAQSMQPEEPLILFGDTLFEVRRPRHLRSDPGWIQWEKAFSARRHERHFQGAVGPRPTIEIAWSRPEHTNRSPSSMAKA